MNRYDDAPLAEESSIFNVKEGTTYTQGKKLWFVPKPVAREKLERKRPQKQTKL